MDSHHQNLMMDDIIYNCARMTDSMHQNGIIDRDDYIVMTKTICSMAQSWYRTNPDIQLFLLCFAHWMSHGSKDFVDGRFKNKM